MSQSQAQVQAQAQVQSQTQTQTQVPVQVVKERSFATFSLGVTFLIVLAIFCVVYFVLRRKTTPKHVDEKAGDEGED